MTNNTILIKVISLPWIFLINILICMAGVDLSDIECNTAYRFEWMLNYSVE